MPKDNKLVITIPKSQKTIDMETRKSYIKTLKDKPSEATNLELKKMCAVLYDEIQDLKEEIQKLKR